MIGAAVLGGFMLDLLFGDPAWLPHPVVYMGKAISALERRLRARLPRTPQGELLGTERRRNREGRSWKREVLRTCLGLERRIWWNDHRTDEETWIFL